MFCLILGQLWERNYAGEQIESHREVPPNGEVCWGASNLLVYVRTLDAPSHLELPDLAWRANRTLWRILDHSPLRGLSVLQDTLTNVQRQATARRWNQKNIHTQAPCRILSRLFDIKRRVLVQWHLTTRHDPVCVPIFPLLHAGLTRQAQPRHAKQLLLGPQAQRDCPV